MSETAKPAEQDSAAKGNGAPEGSGNGSTAVVRYGLMQHVGEFRHDLTPPPSRGDKVVVRTERGVELGEVVAGVDAGVDAGEEPRSVDSGKLAAYVKRCGSDYPFKRGGKILRRANQQDIIDQRHLNESAREEAAFCREQMRRLKLAMKLVAVEHLLGGERIVFYFLSETRVDFRELVRRLAGQYRTRIEMRQVGARDEARLVGDYERCGRRCCCQQFLKNLQPVAMKMAKLQKATLDPSKISGRCGRLMCCLRFEDAGYEELRKLLPRRNTWVRTEQLVGRVVDGQVLTQLVAVQLSDGSQVVVDNEDIVERDMEPPKPGEAPPKPVARPAPKPAEPAPAAVEERSDGEQGADSTESDDGAGATSGGKSQSDESKGGKSRRGRRRRGGKKRGSKGKAKPAGKSGKKSGGSRGSRRSGGKGKAKGKGGKS